MLLLPALKFAPPAVLPGADTLLLEDGGIPALDGAAAISRKPFPNSRAVPNTDVVLFDVSK